MYTSMTPDIMPAQSRQQRAEAKGKEAEDFLLNWGEMSPGEKLRAQYLASHDLTEQELAVMEERERQKIEDEIKEYIKQRLAGVFESNKDAFEAPAKQLASQIAMQTFGLKGA